MTDKIVKTPDEWKRQLSPEAYYITREGETEQAFTGQYDRHKEMGMYRCICCGQPLFSSEAKFDSDNGTVLIRLHQSLRKRHHNPPREGRDHAIHAEDHMGDQSGERS
jgi:hypothetical protein